MIYGDRVRLRAIEREDVPTFYEWMNDPEIRQYLLLYEPMSRIKEEQWVESLQERKDDYIFAIEARVGEGGEEGWLHIGNVGLHNVDRKNRNGLFGIVLGSKEHWGQGYGPDACRAMLGWAFDTLNLHRVDLEVFDFNPRARRCYEKVGFKPEGTRRQAIYHDGEYHDTTHMGLLKGELKKASGA
jgi:RimJ/RimL family protein N-acetyltransferase